MTDLTTSFPAQIRDRIAASVNAEVRTEATRLARGLALRLAVTLGLASYALWTLAGVDNAINVYLYAAVAAVAGLLASDATIRVPQLVAALAARSNPMDAPSSPTRQHRCASVFGAVAMWVLPLIAATGTPWAGIGLAVALLPLIVFTSNVMLRSSLRHWSRLPARSAVELMDSSSRGPVNSIDEEVDEEADAAVAG